MPILELTLLLITYVIVPFILYFLTESYLLRHSFSLTYAGPHRRLVHAPNFLVFLFSFAIAFFLLFALPAIFSALGIYAKYLENFSIGFFQKILSTNYLFGAGNFTVSPILVMSFMQLVMLFIVNVVLQLLLLPLFAKRRFFSVLLPVISANLSALIIATLALLGCHIAFVYILNHLYSLKV